MTVARSDATGRGELDPEVLEFTSSLPIDQALYAADIAGSLAHVRMLEECQIIPAQDAAAIRSGLSQIFREASEGRAWPAEEDIHMAVEVELGRRIGEPAKHLHTARSRNDQVALDARLYLREQAASILARIASLLEVLAEKAEGPEGNFLLPVYTHRQRAQPATVAFLLSAYGQMVARDAAQFAQVLNTLDECPLGVGAVSGTSLPIRRERTAELLGFSRITSNALDTVGDRDFALDFTYAAARCVVHLSRISQDIVDFATEEFGFLELDDQISFGSSMMPHKRNPDLFELVRGKAGRAIGVLTGFLGVLKGVPVGYMRDLQEDKVAYLEAAMLASQCLGAITRGFRGIRFRQERCSEGLSNGFTQATDLAERLVRRGVAFRSAYQAVGTLVRQARQAGLPLGRLGAKELAANQNIVTVEDLEILPASRAVEAKETPGSTGPAPVAQQLEQLHEAAAGAQARARSTISLATWVERLSSFPAP